MTVLRGNGEQMWEFQAPGLADPSRVAIIRFPDGPQIVLGDTQGALLSLSAKASSGGAARWGPATTSAVWTMGKWPARRCCLAANHNGAVGAFGEDGMPLWTGYLERAAAPPAAPST